MDKMEVTSVRNNDDDSRSE